MSRAYPAERPETKARNPRPPKIRYAGEAES
jgi:hypothetical protein